MAKQVFIAVLLLVAISGIASTTHATATEAATTPGKLVEKFQDQALVEAEVIIKLPQHVRVPNGGICNTPKYDECDPDCLCIIPLIWRPGICACPLAVAAAATEEAARKMVGKFQDETVEKLIKLPQRVGTPRGSFCVPPRNTCNRGCYCAPLSSGFGVCVGSC